MTVREKLDKILDKLPEEALEELFEHAEELEWEYLTDLSEEPSRVN